MAWINGFQVWLTESQSLKNAQMVVNFLSADDKDWSKEAIAALIGNMRHESSINPNMYEYGYSWSADRGFGLVQWTPRSKFWNWGTGRGYSESDLRNGDSQLARIDYEVDNNIQYVPNGHQARYGMGSKYNFSFSAFRSNSVGLSVNQLTEAFMWNYEGPAYSAGTSSLAERQAFANRAYNELDWSGTNSSGGADFGHISDILDQGKIELMNSIEIDTQKARDYIMEEITKLFNRYVVNLSQDYDANSYFKITHAFNNQVKINPTAKMLGKMLEIIVEGMSLIEVNVNTDGVFNSMKEGIKNIIPSSGSGSGSGSGPAYPTVKEGTTITSRYGYRGDIGVPGSSQYHWAIDIGSGGRNVPIYATQDGVVSGNFWHNVSGWVIRIEHTGDSYHSQYQHMASQSPLSVGTTVKKGDEIGTMGTTGASSGIHLDFSISINGTFYTGQDTIDPEIYLGLK